MITYPLCKINIGLWVTNRRSDGYHNIETLMYPILWKDALEIIPSSSGKTSMQVTGLSIDGNEEDNLCYKAWQMLHKEYNIASVQMHLHKNIPSGAGLGGGSADAAYALKMLNALFSLNLDEEKLKTHAMQLGMDCPFFVSGKPMIATGRGELLEEIDLDLSGYWIVIIKPDCSISTALAYGKIVPQQRQQGLHDFVKQDISSWKYAIHNDFEDYAVSQCPEIKEIKDLLYENHALYAAMSGSGSAVFGIFEKEPAHLNFAYRNVFVSMM